MARAPFTLFIINGHTLHKLGEWWCTSFTITITTTKSLGILIRLYHYTIPYHTISQQANNTTLRNGIWQCYVTRGVNVSCSASISARVLARSFSARSCKSSSTRCKKVYDSEHMIWYMTCDHDMTMIHDVYGLPFLLYQVIMYVCVVLARAPHQWLMHHAYHHYYYYCRWWWSW